MCRPTAVTTTDLRPSSNATLRSDNTVFAQLALDVGIPRVVDVAHRMGITSELNADPAIALGGLTYGVSPLEMASAYATLANGGVYVEPTIIQRIRDADGNVIWEAAPKTNQALSPGVAYDATRVLVANIQRGTGTGASIGRPAAGKTGTTSDWTDAWFVGYTPTPLHGGLDGRPRRPGAHDQRARQQGHRRQLPGDHVEEVHVHGRQGLPATGSSPSPRSWAKYDHYFVSTVRQRRPPRPRCPAPRPRLAPPSTSSTTTTSTSTTSHLDDHDHRGSGTLGHRTIWAHGS